MYRTQAQMVSAQEGITMSKKYHRLVAVCGALMLLFTAAMAMRSTVASTEPAAPAPKTEVKTVIVPAVDVQPATDDNGCVGSE